MEDFSISLKEREYLRDLAKKQLEYSMLPIMKEREEAWYRHNDLKGEIPMIHFETWTCEKELLPDLKCESEAARRIELKLLRNVVNHELIDDDTVVPSFFMIEWDMDFLLFNLKVEREYSKDIEGRDIGHKFLHPIKDLYRDMHLLGPTYFSVDRERTMKWKAFLEDVLGDILPVRLGMGSIAVCLSQDVVHLMGMENMIYSLVDYPDEFHQMMRRMTDDYMAYIKWMEKEGLLLLNNGNFWLGQGSFGFTHELPAEGYNPDKAVRTKDLWGFMDSQEMVGISPDMYGEFFFPYYKEVSENFGLLSYGCCEPVHAIWEKYLSTLPNLRKVSISPWCDEEYMGEALKGKNVIYHRKPSPNFVGVGKELDEEAFSEHILKTIKCARGCKLEFSFRDVYNLEGNREKPGRAVKLVRQLLDSHWR